MSTISANGVKSAGSEKTDGTSAPSRASEGGGAHPYPSLAEIAQQARNRGERRVGLYARVSTPTQDPMPQLVKLRAWAAERGFVVAIERHDVATGKNVRRPGFEDIMAAAKGHHVHAVAVVKIDRAARSVMHLSRTVHDLHSWGVDFYAIDQGVEVRKGDPTAKLLLNLLGGVAEWEGDIISERTRDSLAAKKEDGVKLGAPLKPCFSCAGPRSADVWGKRRGKRVPLCGRCKAGGGSENGMPPAPSETGAENGGVG